MPLVIREAIGWNIPSLIYNLDVYLGYFDKYKNIKYLDFSSKEKNKTMILQSLKIKNKNMFNVRYDSSDNKIWFNSIQSFKNLIVSIKDAESNSVLWSVNYEHFPSNIDYWVIPTPKSFIDFEKSPLISSLSIEFFEMNKLIYKKDIKIKESTIKKYKLKLENHTEPTFINYCEFFIDGIYDKYLKGKSYQTVVDVGANIGLWVEYIQNVADIKTIYAVEPNLKALDCLKTSYGDSIQIVNKAMANIDGQLDFFVDTENSTISSLAQYGSLTTSYKVDSITFKTFLKQYGLDKVDLLKIDIETGEYPLLESFDNSDFEKIDNLLIEYHLLSGRTYEKDVNYILNKLKMTGYYVYVKNMHDIGGFIFASKQELPESVDNIEIKKLLDNNGCPDKGDLASLVNKMFPNGIGVEIGVLRGDYSKIILERWPAGTLYLIDTWRHLGNYIDMNGQDDVYHYECLIKTCENIKHWQDRAHIIRMDSALSANLFPDEYFDFIYIDADHSYGGVVRDIEAWWPKIKKGGLFCGDDYISDDGDIWLTGQGEPIYAGKFGVRRAVNEFIKKKDLPLYETKNEPYWKQWYTFKPF
jgi:FkbM family methyltransferase